MAISPESSATLVVFNCPLIGFRIRSLWPAVISPSPNIMMGVMEIIVIIIMEAKTRRHIVETDRQLRRELLLMLTEHNFFCI